MPVGAEAPTERFGSLEAQASQMSSAGKGDTLSNQTACEKRGVVENRGSIQPRLRGAFVAGYDSDSRLFTILQART